MKKLGHMFSCSKNQGVVLHESSGAKVDLSVYVGKTLALDIPKVYTLETVLTGYDKKTGDSMYADSLDVFSRMPGRIEVWGPELRTMKVIRNEGTEDFNIFISKTNIDEALLTCLTPLNFKIDDYNNLRKNLDKWTQEMIYLRCPPKRQLFLIVEDEVVFETFEPDDEEPGGPDIGIHVIRQYE